MNRCIYYTALTRRKALAGLYVSDWSDWECVFGGRVKKGAPIPHRLSPVSPGERREALLRWGMHLSGSLSCRVCTADGQPGTRAGAGAPKASPSGWAHRTPAQRRPGGRHPAGQRSDSFSHSSRCECFLVFPPSWTSNGTLFSARNNNHGCVYYAGKLR